MECSEATRSEIVAQLGRLAAREAFLREQRTNATFKLERCVRERERLERHLSLVSREEESAKS